MAPAAGLSIGTAALIGGVIVVVGVVYLVYKNSEKELIIKEAQIECFNNLTKE